MGRKILYQEGRGSILSGNTLNMFNVCVVHLLLIESSNIYHIAYELNFGYINCSVGLREVKFCDRHLIIFFTLFLNFSPYPAVQHSIWVTFDASNRSIVNYSPWLFSDDILKSCAIDFTW